MEKLFIQNRHNLKICVQVEKPASPIGLAFVMPGLAGFKEKGTTATQARAFYDNNYITVSFDPTNSLGESEGDFADATVTNYYEDLEDVILWAAQQTWYKEPFVLCGHSLGGMCVALYAEKYPEKVKALAPLATPLSGQRSRDSHDPQEMAEWEKNGFRVYVSRAKPGVVKNFKWNFMVDILKYNILKAADKLMMPVLVMTGELDKSETVAQQKILFDALSSLKKEFKIIPGAPHTWREPEHLSEAYNIISHWVKSLS